MAPSTNSNVGPSVEQQAAENAAPHSASSLAQQISLQEQSEQLAPQVSEAINRQEHHPQHGSSYTVGYPTSRDRNADILALLDKVDKLFTGTSFLARTTFNLCWVAMLVHSGQASPGPIKWCPTGSFFP